MEKILGIRKKQKALHPNATQYTLNLGKHFFGLWRQSLDRKQSIFAISNVTSKKRVLKLNKINLLSLENWTDLLNLKIININKKEIIFNPYQTIWLTNK